MKKIIKIHVDIDEVASGITKKFKGDIKKINGFLSDKLKYNIPKDVHYRDSDEDIILSDPTLRANLFASLNLIL